jgi:hypothetical protein
MAFFAYEAGALGPRLRRRLRAAATPAFAAALLGAPPRLGNRRLPEARLRRLLITPLFEAPPAALVSGSARRGGETEEFSFLFRRREGRWLASGPGE